MSPINWNASIPPHMYKQLMQGNWNPSPTSTFPILLPDDAEQEDCHEIGMEIERYLRSKYPKFEPEIIYTPDKEYFLPALKVLLYDGKRYFSPSYREQWVDGELRAFCKSKDDDPWASFGRNVPTPHQEVPDEECDCGIYGSVNLEEIHHYLYSSYEPIVQIDAEPLMTIDFNNQVTTYTYPNKQKQFEIFLHPVLCVIEPMPDAKVILCRKGWKTSHAFISEIVRDTISVENASQLLSIAWKRNIDLRRLYNENR